MAPVGLFEALSSGRAFTEAEQKAPSWRLQECVVCFIVLCRGFSLLGNLTTSALFFFFFFKDVTQMKLTQ